ncbi:hypothetical protein TrispH2_006099 [Trichoplax sp. H2]|nr:hypothetical protein TrispH2_006099 [Trichoplax sp. H2]|eukprot:RDD43098.1 hypothetical protein TrispH2_006099 [Trichoplax sp. H2]
MSRLNIISRESNTSPTSGNVFNGNHVLPRPSTRSACSIPMLTRRSDQDDSLSPSIRASPRSADADHGYRRNYSSNSAPSYTVKQMNYLRTHPKTRSADPRVITDIPNLTRKYNKSLYDSLSPQEFFKKRMQTISRANVSSRMEIIYGRSDEDIEINRLTNIKANKILQTYNTDNTTSKYIFQKKIKPRGYRRENFGTLPIPSNVPLDSSRMLVIRPANVSPRCSNEDKKLPRLKQKMSEIRKGWVEEKVSLSPKSKDHAHLHQPGNANSSNHITNHNEPKKVTFSLEDQKSTATEKDALDHDDESKDQTEGWTQNSVEFNVIISPRHSQSSVKAEDLPNLSSPMETNELAMSQPDSNHNFDNNHNLTNNQELEKCDDDDRHIVQEENKTFNEPESRMKDQDNSNQDMQNSDILAQDIRADNNGVDISDHKDDHQSHRLMLDETEELPMDTIQSSQQVVIEVSNQLVTNEEDAEQD